MPATRTPFMEGSTAPKLPSAPSSPSPWREDSRPHLYALPTPVSASSPSAPSAEEAPEYPLPAAVGRRRRQAAAAQPPMPNRSMERIEDRLRGAIRVASAVLVFLVLALTGLILGHALAPATATVAVQPGDSLYSIAQHVEGAPSVERALADIRSLNALGSDSLQAGQTILVPRY